MRRWTGWMLAGAMTLAGGALAQDESIQQQDAAKQDSRTQHEKGTGGSGMQHEKGTGGSGMQHEKGTGMQPGEATGGSGMASDPKQLMMQGMLPAPTDPKDVLSMLHADNRAEVKVAQEAQQKASSKQVKELARMIEQDHTRADQQVTQLAQKMNVKLDENWAPTDDLGKAMHQSHQATQDVLGRLEGKVFDQAYLTAMVGEHDKTIAKLHTVRQQSSSDKQLTALVDKLMPELMKHRERAYKLLGEEKPMMRQARTPATRR